MQTVVIDQPRVAGTPSSPSDGGSTTPPAAAVETPMQPETAKPTENLAELRSSEEPAPAAPAAPSPAQSPAAASVPATAASGYLVQLSATGSQDEAQTTYNRLQGRYPAILGKLDANIQRADLGDKGVFYRVRVGPWEQRDDATAVCEALKSAGADCYVTR